MNFIKILQVINVILISILVCLYYNGGPTIYINEKTIFIAILISAQIHIFLKREKLGEDPFVFLLCFQLIFFYCLRLITLYKFSFSVVFLRYPFTANDLNHSLWFIFFANLFFYLGLKCYKSPVSHHKNTEILPNKPVLILFPILLCFFVVFIQQHGSSDFARVFNLLSGTFLNIFSIILFTVIYYVLFEDYLSRKVKLLLFSAVSGFVIFLTLLGSRSSLLVVLYFVIFAKLAIDGSIKIRIKHIFLLAVIIPFSIILFAMTTFMRARTQERGIIGLESVELLSSFSLMEDFSENIDPVIMAVSDRIGFLDYTSEIITNVDKYSSIFNFSYYFKSIIENILSPGFDIFGTPKVSNSLKFIYTNNGLPSRLKVMEDYQSDQITLYGEMYSLFGKWFSLFPIFLIGYLTKKYYFSMSSSNFVVFYLKRGVFLYLFWIMLNSFGFDWLIFDAISILISLFIFKIFYYYKALNLNTRRH